MLKNLSKDLTAISRNLFLLAVILGTLGGWVYADAYSSNEMKFNYPSGFAVSTTTDLGNETAQSMCKTDPKCATFLAFMHDPSYQGGDMGDGYPISLSLWKLKKSEYRRPIVQDYGSSNGQQLLRGKESLIEIAGIKAQRIHYDNSGPEGVQDKRDLIEIPRGDQLYLLAFSYGLTGCNNVGDAFHKSCEQANQKNLDRSVQTINQVISSLKFN